MNTDAFNESIISVPQGPSRDQIEGLRDLLTEATIKCSERCLYQSSKW